MCIFTPLRGLATTLVVLLFATVTQAKPQPQNASHNDSLTNNEPWLPDKDSIFRVAEKEPPFGIFKQNYIITGTTFRHGIHKDNSDAKIQLSVRQRLIKRILPLHTYLFLSYTQRSFWELYRKSKPFYENIYNPTLGLGTPITRKNKIEGIMLLQFEHESNGRDSIWSRSWNRITITGIYELNPHLTLQLKVWVPFALSDNPNIARYAGYGSVAATYRTLNDRFWGSAVITKRGGWRPSANIQLETGIRLSKISNQYLFIQYTNGYNETMIDYDHFSQFLRIGFAIRSRHLPIY